ncbi:MAG TPA: CCA tRNA nucleotidyltransferase [Thermoplasmatales archaeon]|nr:CCA tRNA nucleotidyltransferase [Thermoplasmatales archaeon]
MREIINDVLKRIVPDDIEEKKLMQIVDEIKEKIDEQKPEDAESMLVGSVAKGTYLKSATDIDFFILFPIYYKKEIIGKITISIGKKILDKWIIQYAEHPYIRGFYKGYQVDIVPCYRVRSAKEKVSAVDRTPFHTSYILKNLKEEMKNEVRLLKQFLKGIGCYGAEAKVEGFSGYLTELLILKYEKFLNILKESRKWRKKTVLSIDEGGNKFDEEFVFIDPVDNSRNVAASLSKEKLNFFIFASQEFLKKPKIEFFFPNKPESISKEKLISKLNNFLGICFKKPNISEDILYPQLKKAVFSISNFLEQNDFKVLRKAWHANEDAFFAVEIEEIEISREKIHYGPPVDEKKYVKAFIKKWENNPNAVGEPFIKNGRFFVKIKRKYVDAFTAIKENIDNINFGKNLNEIKNAMRICRGKDLLKFRNFWEEYFCDKYPWER